MAACGGSTMLTNPDDDTPAAMKSATQSAAASPVSATIRGSVVDSSNRPLSSVNIECLGNVQCTQAEYQPSAQGHQHRITQTDAHGEHTLPETIKLVQRHTRQFAKRQGTWFRHHQLAEPSRTHTIHARFTGQEQFSESDYHNIFAFIEGLG